MVKNKKRGVAAEGVAGLPLPTAETRGLVKKRGNGNYE